MRLSKRKRNSTAEIDMTPMIDIVFLLIIFFMTVSQVSESNKERLELPQQQGSEDSEPSTITINVNQDGEAVISGQTVTIAKVITMVSQELAKVGDDPSRVAIVIRADQRGASGGVNEVVKALSRMQITKIRIAVQVPQG